MINCVINDAANCEIYFDELLNVDDVNKEETHMLWVELFPADNCQRNWNHCSEKIITSLMLDPSVFANYPTWRLLLSQICIKRFRREKRNKKIIIVPLDRRWPSHKDDPQML